MALRYWASGKEVLRRRWLAFFLFGVVMIILGVAALAVPWLATLVTVMFFGWLLLFGGVAEVVGAFLARGASGMFLDFIMGVLTMVLGLIFLAFANVSAIVLTIVLACYFLVAGAYRLYTAWVVRFPGRPWALLSGAVAVLLGVLVLAQWPVSAFWLIGTFVGIELIIRGVEWAYFGLLIRRAFAPTGNERAVGLA